jgi:hypothetical protein
MRHNLASPSRAPRDAPLAARSIPAHQFTPTRSRRPSRFKEKPSRAKGFRALSAVFELIFTKLRQNAS